MAAKERAQTPAKERAQKGRSPFQLRDRRKEFKGIEECIHQGKERECSKHPRRLRLVREVFSPGSMPNIRTFYLLRHFENIRFFLPHVVMPCVLRVGGRTRLKICTFIEQIRFLALFLLLYVIPSFKGFRRSFQAKKGVNCERRKAHLNG